jgi:hypothetical protein
MSKEDALRIMRLLSAIEGWSFGVKDRMPDYLAVESEKVCQSLSEIVLSDDVK